MSTANRRASPRRAECGTIFSSSMWEPFLSRSLAGWLFLVGCAGSRPPEPLVATPPPSGAATIHEEPPPAPVAKPAEQAEGAPAAASPPAAASEPDRAALACLSSTAKLGISVDRSALDLDAGKLRVRLEGPICRLTLSITTADTPEPVVQELAFAEGEQQLTFAPVPRQKLEKIEIRITAKDNAYQAVTLLSWSATIEHQEVEFDTDQAKIRDSELPVLEESLVKIKDVLARIEGKGFGRVTLFIAGHTDTQGSAAHNLELSRNRARAIAAFFQKRGLCVPIAYDGFGESALRKLTGDEVDEPLNRRADYILAVEPPVVLKGSAPAYRWLSQGCPR